MQVQTSIIYISDNKLTETQATTKTKITRDIDSQHCQLYIILPRQDINVALFGPGLEIH